MSPEERQRYIDRAEAASRRAQELRERQVDEGQIETALTVAAAYAMLPHIILAFRDTPVKQAERRAHLLQATYGEREAA